MKKLYKDIRPTIRSGDLIAWSNRKFQSFHDLTMQCIRVVTRSEYVHIGTAWVINNRVFVIEATVPKVRIFPLSKLLPFFLVTTNASWKDETEEFALAQVGDLYSILQAMQSIINKPNLDNNWQCAELAHAILNKDGIDLGDIYTPSQLVYKALENGGSLILITE